MKAMLLSYVLALVPFVAIDVVWLGLLARRFYRANLAGLMRNRLKAGPALAFYLLYPVGIAVFCVQPGVAGAGAGTAALRGALLGLVAYGAYDLTNWATLRDWPARLSLVDMAWGTMLTAVAASLATWIALTIG